MLDLGTAGSDYQDATLRGLSCKRLQLDEIWSSVGAKAANIPDGRKDGPGIGDAWTAIDADTKLVPSILVADRSADAAMRFVDDLCSRVTGRVQVTTDGHGAYLAAVGGAFGRDADYAMLIKVYGPTTTAVAPDRRYSPGTVNCTEARRIQGQPDPAHIATAHVERQNLTRRMSMRRFTRLTNAFSKKVENLAAPVILHFMFYNFARPHMTLSKAAGGKPITPAMAAGKADRVWTVEDTADLLDRPVKAVPWAGQNL